MAASFNTSGNGSRRTVLGAGTVAVSASTLILLGRRMGKHNMSFDYFMLLVVEYIEKKRYDERSNT